MWRPKTALATTTPLPHNANMGDLHPFTFKIEADALSKRQFRWTVCEGDQILLRSPHSYATRREAQIEAAQAMNRRAAIWRRDK